MILERSDTKGHIYVQGYNGIPYKWSMVSRNTQKERKEHLFFSFFLSYKEVFATLNCV